MFWKAPVQERNTMISGQHFARFMSLTYLSPTSSNFNRLKLKASLSLPPSLFNTQYIEVTTVNSVSAIFCYCLFLYHLIIQHFQHLVEEWSCIWIPFVPLVLQMHASSPPGHVACSFAASVSQLITAESKRIFVLIAQRNIIMKHGCLHPVHELVYA